MHCRALGMLECGTIKMSLRYFGSTIILQTAGNHSPSYTASHSTRLNPQQHRCEKLKCCNFLVIYGWLYLISVDRVA